MDCGHPEATRLGPALGATVRAVCERVRAAGGRAWLVGGTVRDCALGLAPGDADLEVFGLEPDALRAVLEADFALDLVGRSFGILKLKDWPLDVGLPRRESKSGLGHRGFEIHADPHLPLPVAAARRDFTINAVYLDPLTGEVADPWRGLDDLEARRLRHTSDAFAEDPLRVLRGMQLASRFELTPDPATVAACRAHDARGAGPRAALRRVGEAADAAAGGRRWAWISCRIPAGSATTPNWRRCAAVRRIRAGIPRATSGRTRGHSLDVFARELSGDRARGPGRGAGRALPRPGQAGHDRRSSTATSAPTGTKDWAAS